MGKQVLTPRFYVDIPTFLHATGQLDWDDNKGGAELLYMNCSNPVTFTPTDTTANTTMFKIGHSTNNQPKTSFPVNFCALLNHNLASDQHIPRLVATSDNGNQSLNKNETFLNNVINMPLAITSPPYNGTSIWTCGSDSDGIEDYWTQFIIQYKDTITDGTTTHDNYMHQLGSMVVGKYWDAPNSPDLSLTMSRRFDGIKRQKTIDGKTLANTYYDGPTEWIMNHHIDNTLNGTYKYPPFELDTTKQVDTQGYRIDYRAKSGLGRKGLRSWNLTFSYIAESDMWMENEVSNTLTSDDVTPNDNIPNPMLSDDSFNFVWNCTLGGALPFIFQPNAPKYDSDGVMTQGDNSPDQFSICTFRSNTLNVKQVASNVYNLSVTIDELG